MPQRGSRAGGRGFSSGINAQRRKGARLSTHGGARMGAGRPKGGISQSRRLLLRALQRGLEIAGREKGIAGTDEAVATEAAAQIAADLIRTGRGDEVLKLLAVSQAKIGDGAPGDDEETPLSRALKALPGMVGVPAASLPADPTPAEPEYLPAQSSACAHTESLGATHSGSVTRINQPFFIPQAALPLRTATAPEADADACTVPASPLDARARGAYGRAPAADPAGGEGGHPPLQRAPGTLPLHGKNFEKNPETPL